MPNGEHRFSLSVVTAIGVLALTGGVLFFGHVNVEDVDGEAEARVLLTAAEMNRAGRWRPPDDLTEARWEKTPLYVWAVKFASLFYRHPGLSRAEEVTPAVARIPAGVSMLALVLLIWWWAFRHFSRHPRQDSLEMRPENFALLTGLLALASPKVVDIARQAQPDATFALFCLAALFCLGESIECRRSFYASRSWRQWAALGYVALGLATLTKGPAAFLYVMPPYIATCLTYKMRRPDWIHFPGLILAAVFGLSWYAARMAVDPAMRPVFFDQLLGQRFGARVRSPGPLYYYLELLLAWFFPWALLAGGMAWINLRRRETRKPTAVLWCWALLLGVLWLSAVGSKKVEYFMPIAAFVPLLAGDALARWDFDSTPGSIFRATIRALRWIAVAVGVPTALLVGSDFGVGFCLAMVLIMVVFAYHRRRTSYVYARWERTVHWAALLAVVTIGVEAAYVLDFVPREDFLSRGNGFINQVRDNLPEDAELLLYGEADSALYSYELGRLLPIERSIETLAARAGEATFLLSDAEVPSLMSHPRLAAVVTKLGGGGMRPRAALFKVIPGAPGPTPDPTRRFGMMPPLRVAVIGDAGRGPYSMQREIGRRLDRLYEERPIHEAILLGKTVSGDSALERIDFLKSFEAPYYSLLERGVPFHAVLSREDDAIAWILTRYPVFQMGERRHYARDFRGGLVRFYALDAVGLRKELEAESEGGAVGDQWSRLTADLESEGARALWRVVALEPPLLSLAEEDATDGLVAERLLPILERHRVQLALWAGEPWHQRVYDPKVGALMLGVGWSGLVRRDATFRSDDPRLQATAQGRPGVTMLEFRPDLMRALAIDVDGETVDAAYFDRAAGPIDPALGAERWSSVSASSEDPAGRD